MNKKRLLLSLGSISAIAVPSITALSCGDVEIHISPRLKHQFVLKDSDFFKDTEESSSAIKDMYYSWTKEEYVQVIDSIDTIVAPTKMIVSKIGQNILDDIKFISNFEPVYVKGSPLVTITNNDANWNIDSKGVVKNMQNNSSIDITVTIGSVSKTITLLQRAKIQKQKVDHFNDIALSANLAFPSVWGTTTSVSLDKINPTDSNSYVKVHMVDVVESKGSTKAYGYITQIETMTNPIEFNTTIEYLSFRIYIPENMIDSIWWFRTYYDGGQDIDFTSQDFIPSKAGWYTFTKQIDHMAFKNPTAKLTKIKLVQMVSKHNALSGDIFIDGLYISDEMPDFKNEDK